DKEVFLQSWYSMFASDHRELLPRLEAPVLVVGGPYDPVTPTDPHLKLIYNTAPMAELVEIPGAGHFSNLDHPHEFNLALENLLARARGVGSQRLQPASLISSGQMEADTVAQALIGLLDRRGIEYFFSNSGTDFTPIIDAFARYEEQPGFRLK